MDSPSTRIDIVVKLGGGLLAHVDAFNSTLDIISRAASHCRLLVVPGGGPFADVVRDIDRRFQLSDDAAHWMAILAMDQHAHLLASRLPNTALVAEPPEIAGALDANRLPVLAPFRWLRRIDPLPHSWDVTSDSIAAWVAGTLAARRLVLVKPPGASGPAVVDPYFQRALPASVRPMIVAADQGVALQTALID